jgi:glycosyltransferase 2 family protein
LQESVNSNPQSIELQSNVPRSHFAPTTMAVKNIRLFTLLKLLVSSGILAFLIFMISWEDALITVGRACLLIIIGAFLFSIVERILVTYKWHILLRARGMMVKFTRLLSINMIGSYFGLFLPSSLSTDAVRGYFLYKDSSEKALSVSSVIMDRSLALLSLFFLASISLLIADNIGHGAELSLLALLMCIVLLGSFFAVQNKKLVSLLERIHCKKILNIIGKVLKLRDSFVEYRRFPKTLLLCFFYSLAVQFIRALTYFLISEGYNLNIPLTHFLVYIPVVIIMIMVPISIGGLGVREGTFVTLFSALGVSTSDAVVVSFTSSLITNLLSLSGGIFYLVSKSKHS